MTIYPVVSWLRGIFLPIRKNYITFLLHILYNFYTFVAKKLGQVYRRTD